METTLLSILIYASTIALTVLFAWLYERKADTKIKKIILFFTIIVVPLIVSTFRYKVGIDFDNYREYYDIILRRYRAGQNMPPQFETGFVVLNLLSYMIFNNAQGAFFFMSLLFICFFMGGIIKFKDKISLPISTLVFMTFFYSAFFNGSRQLLAVAIVFFGLSYLLDKKYIKYILLLILASLFHKTALIAILFCFLIPKSNEDIDYSDRIFNILVILFIISFPFFKNLLQYVCSFFNLYASYFQIPGDASVKFLLYVIPPLSVLIYFRRKIIDNDYQNLFWIRLMILQIPIQFMGYYVKYLDRLSLYVSIAQIFIMSALCKIVDEKYRSVVRWLVVVWYIFYYVVVYIFLNGNGVYPYRFKIGL